MQVEITIETLDAAATMVYRRWTEAFDRLKLAKNETHDGSPDWAEFHKVRLESAMKDEAKWRKAKDELVKLLRQVQSE